MITSETYRKQFDVQATCLKEARNDEGFWTGELSSSALGVAVSVIAFYFYDKKTLLPEITRGIEWLMQNINADDGFGDTPDSISNISTSLLCYAALHLNRDLMPSVQPTTVRLARYLHANTIDVESENIAQQILAFYRNDYTFSVPILTTCALCGIPRIEPFKKIPQLPFELSLLPRSFYRFLNLSVVSYAVPALIAVGIAIFKHKKSGKIIAANREKSIPKAIRLLEKLLPQSGGFLEAIPLTAFVSMSLIQSGCAENKVVLNGIDFLKRTQRPDGSWPIDINLSTWVTTLAVKAIGSEVDSHFTPIEKEKLVQHLLLNQNSIVHPFNGAAPGGWGWTNHSGSVPDCDDTPGALIALMILDNTKEAKIIRSLAAGCDWLLGLQNRDGGFPTFSRGWGKLPFDQSCADLTGHVLLALVQFNDRYGNFISTSKLKHYRKAVDRAVCYLLKQQLDNGSWMPLWFGNQEHPQHANPVYGTARVTVYLNDCLKFNYFDAKTKTTLVQAVSKAQKFLISAQNPDYSWGGDYLINGTIEETALAVAALASSEHSDNSDKAMVWLENYIKTNGLKPAPIGLYFASLWYHEKLYPSVMYTEALMRLTMK